MESSRVYRGCAAGFGNDHHAICLGLGHRGIDFGKRRTSGSGQQQISTDYCQEQFAGQP